jgi:hypothetical protein
MGKVKRKEAKQNELTPKEKTPKAPDKSPDKAGKSFK